MSEWLTGWRLSLRMARRDALRARGRSVLVLVMIALPVLAVTAATVAQRTSDVSPVEAIDRSLGTSQAAVTIDSGAGSAVLQSPDGNNSISTGPPITPLTSSELVEAVGGAPLTSLAESPFELESDAGVARAEGFQLDLADPLADGLFDLTSGRLPRSAGEVVVNRALLDRGYAVGDDLRLVDDSSGPEIVGVAESTAFRGSPLAAGPLGSLPVDASVSATRYLVGGGPVSWAEVQRLNARGATVLSRAVLLDPPPDSEVPEEVRASAGGGLDQTTLTVLVLVVTMALLEVVLLAGPAFAVGTRRLQRSLALMSAAGGTPRQARRVVLATAAVLGSVAAVLGVVVGIALAAALQPLLQHYSDTVFGPFEIPWLPLIGVAGFGMLSAFLAAVVPAWLASRQDVVAVLAGRRGDAPPSLRSPLVGGVLIGLGVVASVVGVTAGSGEVLIAAGALLSVLGMVLVVPVVVALVARASRRWPLSLRYAARDAARHRTRTTPAVAAVAATVAGVVALLIGNTSDAAQNEATYAPSLARGVGVATVFGDVSAVRERAIRAVVAANAPGATITPVSGQRFPAMFDDSEVSTYTTVQREAPVDGAFEPLLSNSGAAYGSELLVSDGPLPPGLLGVSDAERSAMRKALAAGGLVAFTDEDPAAAPAPRDVYLSSTTTDNQTGEVVEDDSRTVSATMVHVPRGPAGPIAILSPQLASSLELEVGVVGLVVSGAEVDQDAQEAIAEGIAATGAEASFFVERGYQADDETLILQLILLGLGAVLMLGGTLTATFLALSDARPDLATLAAVGASPRRRRGVAAGYALVVGFVGALLGAAVGFVPGIAISFPLTRPFGFDPSSGPSHYLDVPWLMILALVVALPLLTAGIVALTARSRLPLVARLD